MGGAGTEQLQAQAEVIDGLIAQIKRAVRANEHQPLLKGKITIMIVDERYDFNEWGLMIFGHEMPAGLKSTWNFDQVDAYVVMLIAANDDGSNFDVELVRNVAAIYHDSLASDVPRWFADGMGHAVAFKICTRSEEAGSWEGRAMDLVRTMSSPNDFIAGRLPEDQAGLIAYYFLSQLRANSGRFGKLLAGMAEGQSFNDSFTQAFGQTPQDFLKKDNK